MREPRSVAPGLYHLRVGRGLLSSNVFFVSTPASATGSPRPDTSHTDTSPADTSHTDSSPADSARTDSSRRPSSWSLIDAGSAGCASSIVSAAETLFGRHRAPEAILLTHDHPDHAGSARELAGLWDCPVYAHPDELPLTRGDLSVVRRYANPLDRWMILPLLRLQGSRRAGDIVSRSSLADVVQAFDPSRGVPGLPDWDAVPTPGHTPGHVVFFRPEDRVLVTGDALVTMPVNSWRALVPGRQEISRPPWYATWDWDLAERSARKLADLEPLIVAGGHGTPLAAPDLAARIRALGDD